MAAAAPTAAVIAGPGAGKTRTLVERAVWLVEERGVRPEEITAVTFTSQAAAGLRARLTDRLGRRAAAKLHIGTFHALCLELLGEVKLLGRGEALELAAETLRERDVRDSPRKLLQGVSRVKNGFPPEEAGVDSAVYEDYCARLEALGVLDFDDLLIRALEKDTAGRRCFRNLLVDEFQDVNDLQYRLILAWSRGGRSLFVIGDPDQSIYGFRGASGDCFRRLAADRPDAAEIRLRRNYRSAPEILRAALPVIERNPGGPRPLEPQRPAGTPVRLVRAEDPFAEGIFIAKEIGRITGGVDMLEAQKQGADRAVRAFSDIAVLCRTHRQLELIEKCLRHDDIPCIVSGREDFWETDEVRGFLAYFRSLLHGDDEAARTAAQNLCPLDQLGREEEWRSLAETEKPWRLAERWEERLGGTPALERLRYAAVFHQDFDSLWQAVTLGEEADIRRAAGKGWESGAVRLMTLHAAKGLEFPAVFVAGVRAGELPLERPGRPAELAEERRLLYVGMTRAREELILTVGGEDSPFLSDLPESVVRESAAARRRSAEQLRLF